MQYKRIIMILFRFSETTSIKKKTYLQTWPSPQWSLHFQPLKYHEHHTRPLIIRTWQSTSMITTTIPRCLTDLQTVIKTRAAEHMTGTEDTWYYSPSPCHWSCPIGFKYDNHVLTKFSRMNLKIHLWTGEGKHFYFLLISVFLFLYAIMSLSTVVLSLSCV